MVEYDSGELIFSNAKQRCLFWCLLIVKKTKCVHQEKREYHIWGCVVWYGTLFRSCLIRAMQLTNQGITDPISNIELSQLSAPYRVHGKKIPYFYILLPYFQNQSCQIRRKGVALLLVSSSPAYSIEYNGHI